MCAPLYTMYGVHELHGHMYASMRTPLCTMYCVHELYGHMYVWVRIRLYTVLCIKGTRTYLYLGAYISVYCAHEGHGHPYAIIRTPLCTVHKLHGYLYASMRTPLSLCTVYVRDTDTCMPGCVYVRRTVHRTCTLLCELLTGLESYKCIISLHIRYKI